MFSHQWYCPECGAPLKADIDLAHLLDTDYQKDKFDKHSSTARVTTGEGRHSVFDSGTTDYYEWCVRETVGKGWLRTDAQGNPISAVYCPSTGSDFGTLYRWGVAASR